MTDLIAQLADAIVTLNNASPRLPTKAEIEDIVHKQLESAVLGIGSYPFFTMLPDKAAIQRERDFLSARIRSTGAHELRSVSKAMLDARDAIRKSSYEHTAARIFNEPFDKAAQPCPSSTDGSHAWNYDLRPGTADSDVNVFAGLRCPCGAIKPI